VTYGSKTYPVSPIFANKVTAEEHAATLALKAMEADSVEDEIVALNRSMSDLSCSDFSNYDSYLAERDYTVLAGDDSVHKTKCVDKGDPYLMYRLRAFAAQHFLYKDPITVLRDLYKMVSDSFPEHKAICARL